MDEPIIQKFPTEVFGVPYTDRSERALNAIKNQFCRFLNSECKKPRKSEPHIKVGTCSLGYKGLSNNHLPVIICPHRFLEKVVFDTVETIFLKSCFGNIIWVPEVSMGSGGSIDYVALCNKKTGYGYSEFLCVEFQAAGTTGTPWKAILELKEHGKYLSSNYNYGINWANEFMKTMMQQVLKKGSIIEYWEKKIVFIVQSVAIEYLRKAVDVSDLREATSPNNGDSIFFLTFDTVWEKDNWQLKFHEMLSTNVVGVMKIIGGANKDQYLSICDFEKNIIKKGLRDNIIQNGNSNTQLSILP